jgi:hypothetical protein
MTEVQFASRRYNALNRFTPPLAELMLPHLGNERRNPRLVMSTLRQPSGTNSRQLAVGAKMYTAAARYWLARERMTDYPLERRNIHDHVAVSRP